jgi:MoaA/NifB/PqqE/SkfB family radical SAM enzyme
VPESLLNRQLTLEFFQNQIGTAVVQQIKKITFCGNDGDPIYCRDFLRICDWLKNVNHSIQLVIVTNGGYKPAWWWEELGHILDADDEIHWSLDGIDQQTNEQYRVNCNWSSIIEGVESFNKTNTGTYKVWASIAFKFNQDLLEQQKALAKQYNFDLYQLTKSTKFGSKYPVYGTVDPLEPTDPTLVASGHRFERITELLSNKQRPGSVLKTIFLIRADNLNKQTNYSGICMIGSKGVFLNSQGEFYPCCWTALRYEHNQHWQGKFNLNTKTFNEIIADPFWTTDFLKFDSLECQTKCTRDRLSDPSHTSEW